MLKEINRLFLNSGFWKKETCGFLRCRDKKDISSLQYDDTFFRVTQRGV